MIRREVRFGEGPRQWLLISQVEHARLSGLLAEKCLAKFGGENPALDHVRQELLSAIYHHDDGWAEWEQTPRLDSDEGRPLSFTELPPAEAIAVWDRSIEAAYAIGDLAAWTVAGHFSALLAITSTHASEAPGSDWIAKVASQRAEWFAQWHARNKSLHTAELAGEALKWLQLFDILSLWPCAQYPLAGEAVDDLPEPFLNVDNWVLVREIKPQFRRAQAQLAAGEPCRIVFEPWPFDEPQVDIQAAAHLVEVRKYATPVELLAARTPFVARWTLTE